MSPSAKIKIDELVSSILEKLRLEVGKDVNDKGPEVLANMIMTCFCELTIEERATTLLKRTIYDVREIIERANKSCQDLDSKLLKEYMTANEKLVALIDMIEMQVKASQHLELVGGGLAKMLKDETAEFEVVIRQILNLNDQRI